MAKLTDILPSQPPLGHISGKRLDFLGEGSVQSKNCKSPCARFVKFGYSTQLLILGCDYQGTLNRP